MFLKALGSEGVFEGPLVGLQAWVLGSSDLSPGHNSFELEYIGIIEGSY